MPALISRRPFSVCELNGGLTWAGLPHLDAPDDKPQSGLNESQPDTGHRLKQVGANQFSIKPQHPITQPMKHPVPARVRRDAA